MPRKKRGVDEKARPVGNGLADRLADELRNSHLSGQPLIDEQEFPSGQVRVTVIWDEWDRLPLEDRTAVILRAYDLAEGHDYRERLALVSGLTVPEAYSAGMLPFEIIPALRRGDPVTQEECHKALIDEGASMLLTSDKPHLRFASMDEAEAARKRLAQRLQNSEQVWVITQDVGKVEERAGR